MIFKECDSPTVEWDIFCVEDLSTLLNHLLLIFIWMLRKGAKVFIFARLSISRIPWSTSTVVGSFGIVAHSIDTAVGYSLNTLVYICKIRNRCFRMESQILASVLTKLIIQRITKWFFCSIPFFKLRDNNRGQINFTIARPSISGIPRFTCTIVWSLGIVAHGISTAAVKSARTLIDIWKELPLF